MPKAKTRDEAVRRLIPGLQSATMDRLLICLGPSAFAADGCEGSIRSGGLPARDLLSCFARLSDTSVVEGTSYRVPSLSTVRDWYRKTPKDSICAAMVSQTVAHEKVLVGCLPTSGLTCKS